MRHPPVQWSFRAIAGLVGLVGLVLGSVVVFAVGLGTVVEYTIPTPGSVLETMVVAPDGNLWFTETSANKIAKADINGVILAQYPLPPTPTGLLQQPEGLAVGPDGNLWFTELITNRIGKMNLSGTFLAEYQIPTVLSRPNQIVTGPDNNLWFTEFAESKIGKITTSGVITEYPLPTFDTQGPGKIVVGPDGNLWFTEGGQNRIGKITTAGVITEYPVPTAGSFPTGLTVGPDGNLWFTEFVADKIGRINTAGVILNEYPVPGGTNPEGIVTGPDGNLWYAGFGNRKIGRITTSGAVLDFPIPSGSQPDELVLGPDHLIWFTTLNNRIGKIYPGRPTTLTYAGDTTADYHDPATLAAVLMDVSTGVNAPIAGASLNLALGLSFPTQRCTATTDGTGRGACTVNVVAPPGPYVAHGDFAGDSLYLPSTTSSPFTVTREETTVTYTGATTQDYHDLTTLSAVLTEDSGPSAVPIAGVTIAFTLGSQGCSGSTNASGVASCSLTLDQAAGNYSLGASFAGNGFYLPSNWPGTFAVTREETTLAITSSNTLPIGGATVSALLREDGVVPIAGRTVTFTAGGLTSTGVTDASGVATATLPLPSGAYLLNAAFAGDGFYLPSTDAQQIFVFQPTQFIIWGGNQPRLDDAVKVGATYVFWGAQWDKQVLAGDYQSNASFKGYAARVDGANWVSDPGAASRPPATVDAYIGVLVATHAAKKGEVESGNIVEMVVLRVIDPLAYAPDPGHPGAGVLVAIVR